MAKEIIIGELNIDTVAFLKSATDTKNKIDELRLAQKELQKSGEPIGEQFIKNEVELKKLNVEYNAQKSTLIALSNTNNEFRNSTEAVAESLNKEVTSLAEAKKNNQELLKLRENLNIKTPEGAKALELINNKLDDNNKFIENNVSSLEKQKIGIGNYKTAITGALQDSGLFGGKIGEISNVLGNLKDRLGFISKGFNEAGSQIKNSAADTEGMSLAQKSLTIATNIGSGALNIFKFALAATGIGLVIGAVLLLVGYFKTFDPVVDKVEQTLAGLGATVRVLQVAMVKLFSGDFSGFKTLTGDMKAANDAAQKLTESQQNLNDKQKIQEVSNAKASQQYDELILKSKNRTLTEEQRLDFINKAQAIETANFKERTALANKELENAIEAARIKGNLTTDEIANLKKLGTAYADKLLQSGRITDAELEGIKKSEIGIVEIKAESTKKLEKSQNSEDKLSEDRIVKADKARSDFEKRESDNLAKKKELQDKRIALLNEELGLYLAQFDKRNKTQLDEIDFILQSSKKKQDILKQELDDKKISQIKYDTEILNINRENAEANAQRLISRASAELNLFISENQSKIQEGQKLTEAIIKIEDERNQIISDKKLKILESEKKTNQALIDEKIENGKELTNLELDFLTEKNNLEFELENGKTERKKQLTDQNTAEKASVLQAQNEIDLANSQTQLDAELLQIEQQYNAENVLLAEKLAKNDINQEQFDQKKKIADTKLESAKDLARANDLKKTVDLYAGLGNAAQELFGKNKSLQTAIALAQTYTSANAAYYSQFSPIPTIDSPVRGAIAASTAVISGLANVAQINNVKFEKGGIARLDGKTHAQGGIPIMAGDTYLGEAEHNEGVGILNPPAYAAFMGFNNLFASGKVGTKYAANGGILSRDITSQSFDYNALASVIVEGVAKIPNPTVSVEAINFGQNSFAEVVNGANF